MSMLVLMWPQDFLARLILLFLPTVLVGLVHRNLSSALGSSLLGVLLGALLTAYLSTTPLSLLGPDEARTHLELYLGWVMRHMILMLPLAPIGAMAGHFLSEIRQVL